MAKRLFLIDASNSIYRAFYALPALTNGRGVPTHATLGFVAMLQKVLREHDPDYAAIVWDTPGPTRRHALSPDYKATREATPEDLRRQIIDIRRIVDAYGLASLEHPGEEADDVIATVTRRALEAGLEVVIVSTDRDLMQLVEKRVTLLDTMRDRAYGPEQVEARFGVPPERMLDFRALTGDPSDNIPGVRGIGEKGAARLIGEYGTLDNLLEHASEISAKRPREALATGREAALLSRELSRLRLDLELDLELERLRIPEPDRARLEAIFRELEFRRLLEEIGAPPGGGEALTAETRCVGDVAALGTLVTQLEPASRLGIAIAIEPEESMRGAPVAIALAADPDQPWCVSLARMAPETALESLRPLLEDPRRTWAGHDLKREAVVLARHGIELCGALQDLAVAAYVLDPSAQIRRPDVLARTWLGREIPSREDVLGKGAKRIAATALLEERLAALLGAEAASALALEPVLEERLAQSGQRELYRRVEMPLVAVLAHMEHAGVRIDEPALARLSEEIERDLAALEGRIHALAGEQFKINSPKQLQHILFEKLKLPPLKRTKTGFSTDESVLEELAVEYELPREILRFRQLSKLASTYVDALPRLVHPETGRIHCSFNQTVAATGRLSASNPNLQNIPARTPLGLRIREAFIPAEGCLLLSADYSQIELRILAHLSQDEALLAAFRAGDDIHVRTASQVLDVSIEDVTPEERSRMKAINFGIIYGSSAFGIARQLGISQADARQQIRAYFERYAGVRAFLDRAVERARADGYAETLYGRRRYLPDLHAKNRVQRTAAERMAVNSVIQGTAADLIKRAMVEIDADLRGEDAPQARMILQVHDELLFEVVPGDLDGLRERVCARMRGAAELSVPIEVHCGSGRTWREAH